VSRRGTTALALLAIALWPAGARGADSGSASPLQSIDVTERLGERLPLDSQFTDEDGQPRPLGAFFDRRRPVVLSFTYRTCPMLCGLVLNGLLKGLRRVPWRLGRDFRLVNVSLDPGERPGDSALRRRHHLQGLGYPPDGDWHFLTGTDEAVHRLARAAGFAYRYDPATRQFAHAAVVVVLNPDGRISRYQYGISFDPAQLRLALAEAAEGRAGGAVDRVLLRCFRYDPATRRYGLVMAGVLQGGGLAIFLALSLGVGHLWRRELRQRRAGRAQT
jgi:protein SCO1/2